MDSPLLMPHSQIYGSRSPVRLLDADGTLACLPYHLNIPFCRMVARDTSLTRLKRWTIAPVYRTVVAGGVSRAYLIFSRAGEANLIFLFLLPLLFLLATTSCLECSIRYRIRCCHCCN